jgi:hypothetical protein
MVASLEKSPEAGKALSLPLGVVSPLWMMFAGAATAGVAYWWMTRWTRPTNLEAQLAAPEPEAQPVVEASAEIAPEPAVEPEIEALVEAAPEIVEAPVVEEAVAIEEPPLKLRRRSTKVADAS